MDIRTLRRTLALVATLAALASGLPSHAQSPAWPSKPIRIVAPYAPGTAADVLTRILSERLGFHLRTAVIVENREGAGGVVGTTAVMRAPADGYTVLAVPTAFVIAPQMAAAMPYDPVRDFVPVAKVAFVPLALVVGGQSPFKTMQELLDYMKANPGKVNYGTQGKGTQGHLEIEYFTRHFGLRAIDVPYKSNGVAIADTISNTVAFNVQSYSNVKAQVEAGKLRALAIGTAARLPAAPGVPTFIEATGIPNYLPGSWLGYFVAAGTPRDLIARLEDAILRTVAEPAVRESMEKALYTVDVTPGRQFAVELNTEVEKFARLVTTLGLRGN